MRAGRPVRSTRQFESSIPRAIQRLERRPHARLATWEQSGPSMKWLNGCTEILLARAAPARRISVQPLSHFIDGPLCSQVANRACGLRSSRCIARGIDDSNCLVERTGLPALITLDNGELDNV